jgi:hypothetical protein
MLSRVYFHPIEREACFANVACIREFLRVTFPIVMGYVRVCDLVVAQVTHQELLVCRVLVVFKECKCFKFPGAKPASEVAVYRFNGF